MDSASVLEAAEVMSLRNGPVGAREFDPLLRRAEIKVMPFTPDRLHLARDAHACCGKGRHPAGLNFGDCSANAVARYTGEPLRFKGDDFRYRDVTPAPAASPWYPERTADAAEPKSGSART